MPDVLFIAYDFPPTTGIGAALRSASFARYLPEFGWRPTVVALDSGQPEKTGIVNRQGVQILVSHNGSSSFWGTNKHLRCFDTGTLYRKLRIMGSPTRLLEIKSDNENNF